MHLKMMTFHDGISFSFFIFLKVRKGLVEYGKGTSIALYISIFMQISTCSPIMTKFEKSDEIVPTIFSKYGPWSVPINIPINSLLRSDGFTLASNSRHLCVYC